MKRIITLLLLLSNNIAFAQSILYTGTSTSHAGYAGYYHVGAGLVFHPGDTVSHSVPLGTIRLLGSRLYMFNGAYWPSISTDTTSLSDRINQMVRYTDTTSILNPYQRSAQGMKYTDTAALLFSYARKAQLADTAAALRNAIGSGASIDTSSLSARINQRVRYADTSSMLGSYQLSANAMKYSDTATALSNYARKAQLSDTAAALRSAIASIPSVDTSSLSNRINQRLKYPDTISMLTPYLRKADTASLSTRINTKLNITDTANMRVRLAAGTNITLTGTYPNITIAASGGGGGGGTDTQAYHYTGDSFTGNIRLGSSGSGTRRLSMYLNTDTLLRLGVSSGGFRWGIFNSESSTANNYDAVVIGGANNEASGIRSVAIGGVGSKAQGTNSIGMNGGRAESNGSVAIGTFETYANGVNSTSIGSYTSNAGYSGCLNLSGYGEASYNVNTANNQLVARFTGGYIFRTSSGSDIVTIKPSGVINLKISFVYPDNAAAIAGGLVAGDMYRTSTGQLMIVY